MSLVSHAFDSREQVAAEVLLGCVPPGSGRVLIVDDQTGNLTAGLESMGWTSENWRRLAGPLGPASAWPEGGPYDAACIRLSKDKGAFEMALHAVASVTKADAPVWVYGANDEGIKSAPKRLKAVFAHVEVRDTRRHCRVLEARGRAHGLSLRDHLEAWAATTTLDFGDTRMSQRIYPGVFAKGRLDEGTRLLLSHLPRFDDEAGVLDYAAGSGVIGLRLRHQQSGLRLTMVEADAVALAAAKTNLPSATAFLGYALDVLPQDHRFTAIVANPPYHSGKSRSSTVVSRLVQDAPRYLEPDGALWMVLQNQVNVAAELDVHFDAVELVASDKRYKVWRAAGPKC